LGELRSKHAGKRGRWYGMSWAWLVVTGSMGAGWF
jgi:hypothetical protein